MPAFQILLILVQAIETRLWMGRGSERWCAMKWRGVEALGVRVARVRDGELNERSLALTMD